MKKYNRIIAVSVLTYLVMAVLLYLFCRDRNASENTSYKVEINQIMQGLEDAGAFTEPDLRDMRYVKEVTFLGVQTVGNDAETGRNAEIGRNVEIGRNADKVADTEEMPHGIEEFLAFYQNRNGMSSVVYPFAVKGKLMGFVRFDYVVSAANQHILWIAEGALFVSWLMMFSVLWYIRMQVVKPFHLLSQMPFELAKGHLQVDVEENRGRFFGKFVWGIAMLRDTLYASRAKALNLEKEKKLLLLSISHDIKIPLSAIKLYAKALREEIYETEEQKIHAVRQIEKHALEIEEFVHKIASTASEDILEIDVADSEFYLKNYIDKIREIYEPKCRLSMTEFVVGEYENKLLKGDVDRAVEVMENLMENAVKYGDGHSICLKLYEEDYCQVIEVYNSGSPVSQNEMPHLFDSFFRGSNAQDKSGNGLGLYIARQIMIKMDGDIFARREDEGMCIGLVFRM